MSFHIPALLCSDIFWQMTSSLSQHLRELSEILAITSGVKLRASTIISRIKINLSTEDFAMCTKEDFK